MPQDEIRDGIPFVGGRLWIDFINSGTRALGDSLATETGLTRWAAAAGLPAPDSLGSARDLRAALTGLFENLREASLPAPGTIANINLHLAPIQRGRRITLDLRLVETGTDPSPLALIAADFADFLADFDRARLRHCDNPDCELVFYDAARNGTRRWCSMALCGNRAKVRAHRARKPS